MEQVAEQLQRALGLKVKIEDSRGRGRVITEYSTLQDFDMLLESLSGRSLTVVTSQVHFDRRSNSCTNRDLLRVLN